MAEIVIDATGIPAELTGAGRYAVGLTRALAALEDRPSIEVFVTRRSRTAFEHPLPGWSVHTAAPASRPLRLASQELLLGRLARRRGALVLHGLHYQVPRCRGLRLVVTVHDLTLLEHPEWHDRTKVLYFRHALRAALRRADAVVVPSRFTKERLEALTSPQVPVHVVYHGVEGVPRVDHRLGRLPRRSLVVVGTLEPRKNLSRVIEAFDRLADAEADVVLRLIGKRGWGLDAFDAALARARHRERIEVLGFVPDARLAALLAEASALVYPSLEEGFGLPVLEGLAAGLTVVTSRGSVMEEVAGGFAILVDPTSPEAIAEGLRAALVRSRPPEEIEAQIAWARSFTWSRAAEETLAVYRAVGSG